MGQVGEVGHRELRLLGQRALAHTSSQALVSALILVA